MKCISFILVLSMLTVSAFSQKVKSLFNKKDLSGWTINGTEKWYVDKGELVCESGPDKKYGYLSTNSLYKDFVLVRYQQQFRLTNKANHKFLSSAIVQNQTAVRTGHYSATCKGQNCIVLYGKP